MEKKPPEYWPPPEERDALERRLKLLRPLWAVITCVLAAFVIGAIWLGVS